MLQVEFRFANTSVSRLKHNKTFAKEGRIQYVIEDLFILKLVSLNLKNGVFEDKVVVVIGRGELHTEEGAMYA